MGTVPTQIRIDESTKKQASELLAGLGLNLSEAVNIFLKQVVIRGGLPFEVNYPEYKPEITKALCEAKAISQDPSTPRFNSFKDALEDISISNQAS